MSDVIHLDKVLPVLIGENYEHVFGEMSVKRTPGQISVTVKFEGEGTVADRLAEFLMAEEVTALSFVSVPVVPRTLKG